MAAAKPKRADPRERKRKHEAAASLSGRNIWPIPAIADPARRERCRKSLRLFCETYNPGAFNLGWSDEHLRGIARIEEAARHGALFAFAWPRGDGKTTVCRMASLWVISYAIRRYLFLIGAEADKAKDSLQAIKTYMRFLPDYAADFPEIAHPANRLAGIANRAKGQVCGKTDEAAEATLIEWSDDKIVLPRVPCPKNWKRAWGRGPDGMVPTAGSVISASGLTADGIRGSVVTLRTGESLRPDFVVLDDPQTPESARSYSQNRMREQLISADVLGMAGAGKSISAVMPCTVIAPGDMVDNLLDRTKHPSWRGERSGLLRSMPTNLDAWELYREVWARCLLREPPDMAEANAYYIAHRDELDEGAEATWEGRKKPDEVSAIQSAMHFWLRDKVAFFSEGMNQPLPLEAATMKELTPDLIACRVNNHVRELAPGFVSRLVAFIDVQQDLLPWVVCGWGEEFSGAVIAYGAWPDQRRGYWTLADARPTLQQATGIGSLEGALWAGLSGLTDDLLGREWSHDGSGPMRIERCLIDSGWGQSTDLVKRFCRQSQHESRLVPSKGVGISASANPIGEWPRQQGERRGQDWVLRLPKPGEPRLLLYDANAWKSFAHARLTQPLGERGALTLFGGDSSIHRLIADHCCSEYRVRTRGRGRELDEWKWRPGRPDNHLWDCLVGCCVAASFQGVAVPGGTAEPAGRATGQRRRVSYRELQEKARSGR